MKMFRRCLLLPLILKSRSYYFFLRDATAPDKVDTIFCSNYMGLCQEPLNQCRIICTQIHAFCHAVSRYGNNFWISKLLLNQNFDLSHLYSTSVWKAACGWPPCKNLNLAKISNQKAAICTYDLFSMTWITCNPNPKSYTNTRSQTRHTMSTLLPYIFTPLDDEKSLFIIFFFFFPCAKQIVCFKSSCIFLGISVLFTFFVDSSALYENIRITILI